MVEAAQLGDGIAIEELERIGYYVGIAVSNVINLINPEMVVVSVAPSGVEEVVFGGILASVNERTFSQERLIGRVSRSTLGPDAGVVGAGGLILKELFEAEGFPLSGSAGLQ